MEDEKELMFYCYSVAGTVGYMFCKIINVTDKKLMLRAIQLELECKEQIFQEILKKI